MLVNTPKVSIVIPIKGINDYAKESIDHCLNLKYPDFEILLLPDSQLEMDSPNLIVIPTGSIGPSEKRDIALDHATGEVIAFIDDDAYPNEFWLSEAVKHLSDEDVAAVGGPAVTPVNDGIRQKASGLIFSSLLGSGSLAFRYIPKKERLVDDYPSCNFIVRKSILNELGGFNSLFWPGEDTILCLQITHKLGKKIVYDPKVLVFHHRRKLFLPHLKQVWNYAVHRGYFAKKFPETSRRLSYLLPSILVLGILIGLPASFFNPVLGVVFLSLIAFYITLVLLSSFTSKDIRLIILVFFGIIATHLTYGVGLLRGLLARDLVK